MKLFIMMLLAMLFVFSCGEEGKEGVPGKNGSLVKLTQEASGTENCSGNGGTRVDLGIDVSGDGVLDDSEITSTSFVCNGSDGSSGEPGESGNSGKSSLVTVSDEPSGTENCEGKGGSRIESGADENSDGFLQEEEISQTKFICNEYENIYYGSLTISSNKDIEEVSSYDMIVGNVFIYPEIFNIDTFQAINQLTVNKLRKVTGSVMFYRMYTKSAGKENSASFIKHVAFPDLEFVGGAVSFYGEGIESLSFPKLKEVGSSSSSPVDKTPYAEYGLNIRDTTALEALSFPSLEKGYIGINYNEGLTSADFSSLKSSVSIRFYNNPLLSSLNLSSLENAGRFYIQSLPELTSLNLSKLKFSTAGFNLSNLPKLLSIDLSALEKVASIMSYNELALESISLPKVTEMSGEIDFYGNMNLKSVNIPNLKKLGSALRILNNAKLEQFSVPMLENAYEINVSDNDSLSVITFPELTELSDLIVSSTNLTSFNAPKLKSVSDRFDFTGNTLMEKISFPQLTEAGTETVVIKENAVLTGLEMPALVSAGTEEFNISGNIMLSECYLLGFINQITSVPNITDISGNKSCYCYDFNSSMTAHDEGMINSAVSFMKNNAGWSIAEKMIIPKHDTSVIFPHLYRGLKNTEATGNFKITADGISNTVTASVHNGNTWITLSGTDMAIKPGSIISVILNYNPSSQLLSLYINGVSKDSETFPAVNDSANTAAVYVGASLSSGSFTDHVPYSLLHAQLVKRTLTAAEITDYTETTSAPLSTVQQEDSFYNIYFMEGSDISSLSEFTVYGTPLRKSVLYVFE